MVQKITVKFSKPALRFGLIVPSSNTNMETELCKMMPADIFLHSDRMRMRKVNAKELISMDREAERAAVYLSDAKVNVIAYGCTIAVTSRKPGYHRTVRKKLELVAKTPVVVSAEAVLDAMSHMGMKRIAVATPYTKRITEMEMDYFRKSGFDITDYKYLSVEDNVAVGRIRAGTVLDLVKSLDVENADGILISCAELPSVDTIKMLEDESGLPVISTNTATMWAMIRRLNLPIKIGGYGRLLEE